MTRTSSKAKNDDNDAGQAIKKTMVSVKKSFKGGNETFDVKNLTSLERLVPFPEFMRDLQLMIDRCCSVSGTTVK